MLQGQALYGTNPTLIDDGVIALGRSLFASLPEDAYDRGPHSRANFRFVADARLDNRPDLAASLGLESADATRMCDAELLFRALLKWGDDAVNRLVGEFAFALWDGGKQHLLLARDIFGLRPLHFHRSKDFFAFSSMPSGLHALAEVPHDFDTEFMVERLSLLPQVDRRTYFRDIERVQPGHLVRVTANGIHSHAYWRPPGPAASRDSRENYEEGLRCVLEQAVRAQLRGAGDTVATQLSGGLDSSIVTSTVARLAPKTKVIAYTAVPRAGFDGPTPAGTIANEAELAAATARLYPNIEHVIIENSGESPLKWLDRNFVYQQQPMANLANAVWGQAIHHAARSRGSKIIFKGTMGNLTISFSGQELLPLLLSHGRLLQLLHYISNLSRNGVPLLTLAAQTVGPFVPAPMWLALRKMFGKSSGLMSFSAVNRAYADKLARISKERGFDLAIRPRRDPYEIRHRVFRNVDGGNAYKGVLGEWGLSVRDPTSDKRVIEYCLTIPAEEFISDGVERALARKAFSDRLPHEVISSGVRGYQSADWYEALDNAQAEIGDEIAAIERCAGAGEALEMDWLKETVSSWPSGGWHRDTVRDRYRLGLLRGISAGHFMRKVRGTN